ncbi:MAG TPA: Trp biosynthesis-associated membrane protein [Aeromicrobium sp.]|nr:Trp biosynthesis-associated membrane protein [Aeromicrobium sp.]
MPKVVLGLLATGAVALFAVTRAWASATVRTSGLPTDHVAVSGVDAAPILAGLAVVIMAAGLGVVAAGGRLRQLIGVLIAAVAGLAALRALTLNPGGPALSRALKDSPAYIGGANPPVNGAAWPWLSALAFVVAAALGAVVAVRGRAWPRMSARYEREAPSVAEPADEADLWRAQDEGQDPTLGDEPR